LRPDGHLIIRGPLFDEPAGTAAAAVAAAAMARARLLAGRSEEGLQPRATPRRRSPASIEEGLVVTPEQKQRLADLEKAAAEADEARKKKEGEFDSWRKDITTKHQTELQKATERAPRSSARSPNDKIQAAFGAATDYFGGGEKSKTILTPTLAFKTLREHVAYEEYDFGEDDGGKRERIVVRDARGKIIRGDNGHPAVRGRDRQADRVASGQGPHSPWKRKGRERSSRR
jgi:hypothetical protein